MKKTFCFDIDGVIATLVKNLEYDKAKPIAKTIELINLLYKLGHKIILFTARGSLTNKNWRTLTEQQMESWGVHYHELKFGKPAADYYIDDRLITLIEIKQFIKNGEKNE